MESVEIRFEAKDLKHAARNQEQLAKQMELIGYQLKEFRAIPEGKKVNVTLLLIRKKK